MGDINKRNSSVRTDPLQLHRQMTQVQLKNILEQKMRRVVPTIRTTNLERGKLGITTTAFKPEFHLTDRYKKMSQVTPLIPIEPPK